MPEDTTQTHPPTDPAANPDSTPDPIITFPTADEVDAMEKTLDALDAINPEVLKRYAGFFAKFRRVRPKIEALLSLHSPPR